MIKVFVVFIFAIIISVVIVKIVWDFVCRNDEEQSISNKLIGGGIAVVMAIIPSFSDALLQFLYDFLQMQKTGSNEGLSPRWLIVIGILLLIVGIVLKIKDSSAKYIILNMPGTIHHTKEDGMLRALNTIKCDEIETNTANCQSEMQQLSQARANAIMNDIRLQMDRFNRQSIQKRCFTGMAPIPFVIYAGLKHRGNDIRYYLEFNKATQQYTKLNGVKEFPNLIIPAINSVDMAEIIVTVSTTARIVESNTRQFNMPVFGLSLEETKDNAIFSKRQLDKYVSETVTFISEICKHNSGIKRVNLLLSTQACFAYALGKSLVLMQNRVPQIVSYHYSEPSYNVGIILNGKSSGQVIKPHLS